MSKPSRPKYIGIRDAADMCDVDERTIRRWISRGHLKAVRVGPHLIKIDITELDKLFRPVGGGAA